MMKQKLTRAPGNKTRAVIVKNAKKLFIKHGFAGTSMSMISRAAKVNRSLIFHHFESKQKLWQAVKSNFLDNAEVSINAGLDSVPISLEELIRFLVESRLTFYEAHPDAFKLMCWQIVDANAKDLVMQSQIIEKLLPMIKLMQKQKQINSIYEPEVVIMMLFSAAYPPLMLQNQMKYNQKQKEQYIVSMIDMLVQALRP